MKKNEVMKNIDTAIEKGNDVLEKSRDFIDCVEILLGALTGLKVIFDKYVGGEDDE